MSRIKTKHITYKIIYFLAPIKRSDFCVIAMISELAVFKEF